MNHWESIHILVLDEVGEFIWPSIWVIVLANRGLGVAVLAGGRCSCDGGSLSGRRLRGCMAWLVEWSLAVDLPCAPFGSSIPSSLAMVLLITGFDLVVVVLSCGKCLGGGGSSDDR